MRADVGEESGKEERWRDIRGEASEEKGKQQTGKI